MADARKGNAERANAERAAKLRQIRGAAMSSEQPQGKISAARRAAFDVLAAVSEGRGHSDDLLHASSVRKLSEADRHLATALALGVLRWQIALDARIRPLLQRPETKLADGVAIALRLGAFQLLHMDRIPAHAALSESVELTRAAGHEHAAGMVNAVLRKLAVPPAPVAAKVFETLAAMAQRLGHPLWLVERWAKEYGRAAAIAICEAGQREPEAAEIFAEDQAMPRMDDGSRLVAELAACAKPGAARIWDCCAAPGGKTLVLAARHREGKILATDANPRRVRVLGERMKVAANVCAVEADAAALAANEGDFDLILCDVPCSGTGTLGRNPEIRHTLQLADFERQAARQRKLLQAALLRLAPGGRLVYSTCSLEPEENEAVVAAVMSEFTAHPLRRVDVAEFFGPLRDAGLQRSEAEFAPLLREGALRTLPGANFKGDGFFAVVIEHVG